ncbi:MAG: hypothetical protein ACK587_10175 [Cyanobacteriota bacterium]|jgi:hypothetical protein
MESLPPPPIPSLRIERAVAPIAFPDPALEKALQGLLFPPGSPVGACHKQGGARYVFNRFDLDGDRQPEILVALLGQRPCGKGGCSVLLLRSAGEGFIPLQTIAGLHSSLVVSERRSHGWRDLILPSSEASDPAPLRLEHNGARYPSRPEAARTGVSGQPARGVLALALRPSPWLVQGHPLPCPPLQRLPLKRLSPRPALSRDPRA